MLFRSPPPSREVDDLEKAARGGDVKAQYELGVIAAQPETGNPDYGKAAYWFREAAIQGNASAQYNPGVAVATKDVFRSRNGPFSQTALFDVAPLDARRLARLLLQRRNDLTAAATIHAPAIREARERVGATDGCLLARMSGSGATVFGLYASAEEAERAGEAILRDRPTWWCWSGAIRS